MNQYTGNDNHTRKTAGNIQPDDRGRLGEELLQPYRQLVNDIKADTDMICTIDELAQAELEVIDDMVHTDLDNDREEIETPNQQAYSEH